MKSLRLSAFSMLELMVAMAISSVVITIATSVVVSINRNITASRSRAVVHEEAKLLAEYLGDLARNVGGETLRPWNAVDVENNCEARDGLPDCGGSDRLTLTDYDEDLGSCSILKKEGSYLIAEKVDTDGDGVETCCLEILGFDGQQKYKKWEDKTANLRNRDGKTEKVRLKKTDATDRCKLEFHVKKGNLSSLVGANMAGTLEKTLFLDQETHELKEFIDANDNDLMDEGESRVLADHVYDFQVGLGYDANSDGRLADDRSPTDEWLYNSSDEEFPEIWPENSLRMISIGVTVGTPQPETSTPKTMQLMDGPAISLPGVLLNSSLSRLYFRNGFIIQ